MNIEIIYEIVKEWITFLQRRANSLVVIQFKYSKSSQKGQWILNNGTTYSIILICYIVSIRSMNFSWLFY